MDIRRRAVNPWLPFCVSKPNRRVRLFCFHHAGGGASVFRRWSSDLPDDVEVWPVQLPGRETRMTERPFTQMGPLVKAVYQALRPCVDVDFALFGHSMGAHVAFELAREVRRETGREPVHLIVAGHPAPQLKSKLTPVFDAPKSVIMARIQRLSGTPQEVLEQGELMELMLPTIRADLEIIETYQCTPETPLSCPITSVWASDDIVADEEEATAWRAQTTGALKVRCLQGDHFFVHNARPAMQDLLREALSISLRDA